MIGARMKMAWTGRSPRIGIGSSVSNESSCRPKAFRSTVTSSSGKTGSSPPAISFATTIIPAQVPEYRRARLGQAHDRLAEPPAGDELAHRRALAAGQDQPGKALEILGQANRNRLDADRSKGPDMLDDGAVERQYANSHYALRVRIGPNRDRCVPLRRATSRGPPAARLRGSRPSRCRASGCQGPSKPRR